MCNLGKRGGGGWEKTRILLILPARRTDTFTAEDVSVFWRSEGTKSRAEEMTGEVLPFIVTDLIDNVATCPASLSLAMEINSQGLVKSRESFFFRMMHSKRIIMEK